MSIKTGLSFEVDFEITTEAEQHASHLSTFLPGIVGRLLNGQSLVLLSIDVCAAPLRLSFQCTIVPVGRRE